MTAMTNAPPLPDLIRQKETHGCTIAALAMVTGKSYDEVRSDHIFSGLGEQAKGASFREVKAYLSKHGYAWQEAFKYGPPDSAAKSEWPCAPWADIHICDVQTTQSHAVVLLRDGTVLDPLTDEPKKLTDYQDVNSVRAVYPVATLRAQLSEARMEIERLETYAERLVNVAHDYADHIQSTTARADANERDAKRGNYVIRIHNAVLSTVYLPKNNGYTLDELKAAIDAASGAPR